MRLAVIFLAALLAVPGLSGPAVAETLMEKAELWGELHAAAIYCRQQDTNDFGRAAMNYLRRRAGGTAEFNRLRDAYGVKAVLTALKPPSRAAGGSCSGFSRKYQEVWQILRGQTGG
ncbi:MAG: hypothetical protein Q8P46_12550 [Hyphomicrobiales bacterium]|nr:hypothetical protein [Hyphomicrobiales bacterium]